MSTSADAGDNNNGPVAAPSDGIAGDSQQPAVVIREVYKNGWLKRYPVNCKKNGPFSKTSKAESVWVVFCVQNDLHPFLEFYDSRRSAFSHSAALRTSLHGALHISPAISPHISNITDTEQHVFHITTTTQAIRLIANSRESMIDWITTLRSRLTELRVLQPADNLYSKEPEMRGGGVCVGGGGGMIGQLTGGAFPLASGAFPLASGAFPLATSRDPNSPLPPPPCMQTFLYPVPGTEPTNNGLRGGGVAVHHTRSLSASLPLVPTVPADTNYSPSAVTSFIRNPPPINRSSQPVTPTSPGSNSFMRNPPASSPPAYHSRLTASTISLPASQHPQIFNFDINTDNLNNTVQTQYAENNTYINMFNCSSRAETEICDNTPSDPLIPVNELNYETIFISPHTQQQSRESHPSIARRRSEVRRGANRENYRRAASVGPVMAPRNFTGREATTNESPASRDAESHVTTADGRVLSLREQQVWRLRREMNHIAGVRLLLRRKDTNNSIAFIDAYNQVWIAGWKQWEHPVLHSAFHIGDCVISVAGIRVGTAQDVHRIIKGERGISVEFVVSRVPHGKVLMLNREYEGQDLGVSLENSGAEVKAVLAGGLVARHHLPHKANCVTPGQSGNTCNWVLTEVNGRPISLFSSKEQEMMNRLNAVGLDISLLFQPSDLIKAIRKGLKAIRGYKDFIVQ